MILVLSSRQVVQEKFYKYGVLPLSVVAWTKYLDWDMCLNFKEFSSPQVYENIFLLDSGCL